MTNDLESGLRLIFRGIRKLHGMHPIKNFTIDGRLVGDIGEFIAATYYDIRLFDVQKTIHDGVSASGRKVQVKATFKDSLTFRKVPDYYLGFKVFENGTFKEIYNGPGNVIYKRFAHRTGIGETLLSFPIKELMKLSTKISASKKIACIKKKTSI